MDSIKLKEFKLIKWNLKYIVELVAICLYFRPLNFFESMRPLLVENIIEGVDR